MNKLTIIEWLIIVTIVAIVVAIIVGDRQRDRQCGFMYGMARTRADTIAIATSVKCSNVTPRGRDGRR
jgi:hypothetical protein